MAELNRTERLQPSLLDRLTDLSPEARRESLDQQVLTVAQLRRAVLRDLGWLLNATCLDAVEELEGAPLAAASTVNFGVAGIAGSTQGDGRRGALERSVAKAIRAFEPRIRPETLRVVARPFDAESGIPTLHLEISGELWAQPVPLPLFLETAIELDTRIAVVTESKARG